MGPRCGWLRSSARSLVSASRSLARPPAKPSPSPSRSTRGAFAPERRQKPTCPRAPVTPSTPARPEWETGNGSLRGSSRARGRVDARRATMAPMAPSPQPVPPGTHEPLAAHGLAHGPTSGAPAETPARSLPPLRPPARRARQMALGLSVIGVGFTVACGYAARKAWALGPGASREASLTAWENLEAEACLPWVLGALCLLLAALLFRMGAAICELLWLERTWSNLPEDLRT